VSGLKKSCYIQTTECHRAVTKGSPDATQRGGAFCKVERPETKDPLGGISSKDILETAEVHQHETDRGFQARRPGWGRGTDGDAPFGSRAGADPGTEPVTDSLDIQGSTCHGAN
jgi:hypothetical protein